MPALLLVIAALLVGGCGAGTGGADAPAQDAPPAGGESRDPAGDSGSGPDRRPRLRQARCPAELDNCAEASGRVVFVEAVDPDGDGDAHYVLAGGDVTAPGLSVIDVPIDLRPKRLPRVGDRVSAAGPVFRGSYGQRQIQAVEVHHSPRR